MSGESLHRRGYRDAMHRASLNEAAAAGALQLAGWPQIARDRQADGAQPCCQGCCIPRLHQECLASANPFSCQGEQRLMGQILPSLTTIDTTVDICPAPRGFCIMQSQC